jgi:hypothetical protein
MGAVYEKDVVAWAQEQAALLRAGRLANLDIEHIAEEIEDVGKSEQRELTNRMAVLLSYLLKWEFQLGRRGSSWERTIKTQRKSIQRRIDKSPGLKPSLDDPDWWADAWGDAMIDASKETGLDNADFPESCPWSRKEVMDPDFFPGVDSRTPHS